MSNFDTEIDTSGLNCPLPLLKTKKALAAMSEGERLRVIATDRGAFIIFLFIVKYLVIS